MKLLLILGSILIPILMVISQSKWDSMKVVFNILALLSTLIFGNIASIAIYDIIKDGTVFMTNIHGLFLNPLFLITGAYLGVYVLSVLLLQIYSFFQKSNFP
ncbi:transposase [Ornithinibacillus halophilus]|uniref:Uncharacterized protein n=1 Tax=Ornithinibacillus halophilus TaxID=930117 RepID=A0A1M5FSN0_9BACI|nr:transposase [Ornithinibacillus halophilus]SHF94513.1 hypothetical protein SAMN05216225_10107 [Ornithinibacillus halophilus]